MNPDYHMHTPLCHHATGHPADYAQEAIRKGLPEIGFADHNPMPARFDDWRMGIEDMPRYFELIEEAREMTPGFPIRLGLECDYLPGHEDWITKLAAMAPWDYLIGSVHYLAPDWVVDNPAFVGRYHQCPPEELWNTYWSTFEKCVRTRLFDFIAHPDLVKIFGSRPSGDLSRYYEPAVTALAEIGGTERAGSALGITMTAIFAMSAVGPYVFGAIADATSLDVAWLSTAALCVVGIAPALWLRSHLRALSSRAEREGA